MSMKKVLKTALSIMLIAMLAVSMFACSEEQVEDPDAEIYSKQLVNTSYYFKQGYPDDWQYSQGADGAALRELEVQVSGHKGVLCTKFAPKDSSDMEYAVYKYNPDSQRIASSLFVAKLMNLDDESSYGLNEVFFEEVARDTYKVTSEEAESATYSHRSMWNKANYEFVKGSDDWKGTMYTILSEQAGEFVVITCEAKADSWDDADKIFQKMLEDFDFVSWDGESK